MKKNTVAGTVMLLICAIIWGTAFVAQSEAMDSMKPLTFQAARSYLGGLVLLPLIAVMDMAKKKIGIYKKASPEEKKKTLSVGIVCGIILCTASLFQQYGIAMGTSAGNAGFITALYILLVPVAGLIIFKNRVHPLLWACVAASVGGLWLICIKGNMTFAISDLLVLCCAFVFTGHIIVVDRFAAGLDGVRISCIQFFTSAIIATVGAFIFESPTLSQISDGWISIVYAGVMSSGVAYTLQILGQQRCAPAVASLIMSLESVFAVLGAVGMSIIVGSPEYPTGRELLGCAVMFAAIIAAQLLPQAGRKTE